MLWILDVKIRRLQMGWIGDFEFYEFYDLYSTLSWPSYDSPRHCTDKYVLVLVFAGVENIGRRYMIFEHQFKRYNLPPFKLQSMYKSFKSIWRYITQESQPSPSITLPLLLVISLRNTPLEGMMWAILSIHLIWATSLQRELRIL